MIKLVKESIDTSVDEFIEVSDESRKLVGQIYDASKAIDDLASTLVVKYFDMTRSANILRRGHGDKWSPKTISKSVPDEFQLAELESALEQIKNTESLLKQLKEKTDHMSWW